MPKILVCGDRYWKNSDLVVDVLAQYPTGTVVVHGDQTGADTIADQTAKLLGMTTKPYPYIGALKKAGGPARNALMLKDNPDIEIVIGFHDDFENSKGTKNMFAQAKKKGIPTVLYTSKA